MSTVHSPRSPPPSAHFSPLLNNANATASASATPSSSRRTSLDTSTRSQATSPARLPQTQQRRDRNNRAALRDYYGLKSVAARGSGVGVDEVSSNGTLAGKDEAEIKDSELDQEGFDAEAYVKNVLGKEGLEGVMRVEGSLLSDIKTLDGERKALVYDNYSKLITATDTIHKMRTNMDPLTPTTSTLSPTISHIADTAVTLAASLQGRATNSPKPSGGNENQVSGSDKSADRRKQQQTVRWVLHAPRRLRDLMGRGERQQAEEDWNEVKDLLDKWDGVAGVEKTRGECERALSIANDS